MVGDACRRPRREQAAYCVGLAAEWPFVSQAAYVGPLAGVLEGAAIAYLLLFALTPGTARRAPRRASTAPGS